MDKIKAKTVGTYNKIAASYSNRHFAHFWVKEFDFLKSIINDKRVLDIGRDAGRDAAVFVANGFNYTGIDISEGMLRVAEGRVPEAKFRLMDFDQIDFSDDSSDGFWAAASFLHVPKKDVGKCLQEAKRVTKVGGVGFISLKERTEMEEGMIEENKYGGISRYFAFYAQDEFKKILEGNGFSIIKTTKHIEDDERKTSWLCYFVKL